MSPPVNLRPCPACEGQYYWPLLVARNTPIYRCRGCGLATWDWPAFDPPAFYDASYWRSTSVSKGYADYFALAAAQGRTHRQRLRWIRRHLRCAARRPRLLDAGCGPGFFVQAAVQAGFVAAGVEVSESAVQYARDELSQQVWQGHVRPADLRGGPYDVVTLWDVIEHLPDPAAALAAVARVLPLGGLLALSTGDLSSLAARLSGRHWHLFTLPEHLWFFTRDSLRRLLRRCGFEPVDWRCEVGWYTLRYLVERLEAMFAAPRSVSPRLGPLGRLPVPMTLADIVSVLAVRRGQERGSRIEDRAEGTRHPFCSTLNPRSSVLSI